jgi:hydrogenase maturation protein HypF
MTLSGRVQGVGFRPFVFRLAKEHSVTGYVQNCLGEVSIVACGKPDTLRNFRHDLIERAPPLSQPTISSHLPFDTLPFDDFKIVSSSLEADAKVYVPADYFMCDDCDRELHDVDDRRYRYPFINCTQCGPRYTLINALPYDRANTSMAAFAMCAECAQEYADPGDRRFHAEPVACPACGPILAFSAPAEKTQTGDEVALQAALECLRAGGIVAVKGVGGYHLMCDAADTAAVELLRKRKKRPHKPLAVMIPLAGIDGLDQVRQHVVLEGGESAALKSSQRPIVLATKKAESPVAANVAPGLDELGVFLPYTPLHTLLLDDFGGPLVATSGNISGEPVLTDNAEAANRLGGIADGFLHHNRPIVRPADDPVYRRIAGHVRPVRLGRGCAPRELEIDDRQVLPLLAVGGHMKGTLALSWDRRAVVSPHIGEMDSPRSLAVFEQVAETLQSLYGVRAERIVCDAHSGYTTHRWAREQALPVETVWHHHAHASALVGEHLQPGPWLIFAWDGVGLGEDGDLWGGEALYGRPGGWRRVASLKTFRLPGGERAGREPWRSAAALHWECKRDWPGCPDEQGLAKAAWDNGLNCPASSAAGRLFDAAAALVLGQSHVSYEAQGPMLLETLCRRRREPVYTSLHRNSDGVWRSDWSPLLDMLTDTTRSPALRAEIFHSSMALMLLQQARRVRDDFAIDQVGLCGGVFQNRVLAEQAVSLLVRNGFRVYLPRRLPGNDAALSFGQAVEIAARDGAR